jgi:phosphoribosylformylglycinamidine synthase
LSAGRQIVVRYVRPDGSEAGYPENPNGAVDGVAGITDPTGRVFGLMPHPERHIFHRQHPRWTRGEGREPADGRAVFQNAVRYFG